MCVLQFYFVGGDVLKLWVLVGELVLVFEKYQVWCCDWLLCWEVGVDLVDLQVILWCIIVYGCDYCVCCIQVYLDCFEGVGQLLLQGLLLCMFVFVMFNILFDVLWVMVIQVWVGELYFYMFILVQLYWGDLQMLVECLCSGVFDFFGEVVGENCLLEVWGVVGCDFMVVLGSYEVVYLVGEIVVYLDLEEDIWLILDEGGLFDSLLYCLQCDLFYCCVLFLGELCDGLCSDDFSLQVYVCYIWLCELQVLYDQFRSLLQDLCFDLLLQVCEIVVFVLDIDFYVLYLEVVFGGRGGEEEYIFYVLVDSSLFVGELLVDVFVYLLGLLVLCFGLNEVLDLLVSVLLVEVVGLEVVDFDCLYGWLQQVGVCWGLDVKYCNQYQVLVDDVYIWQFVLDCLVFGYVIGSEVDLVGVVLWIELEGGVLEVLDWLLWLLCVLVVYQCCFGELLILVQWW